MHNWESMVEETGRKAMLLEQDGLVAILKSELIRLGVFLLKQVYPPIRKLVYDTPYMSLHPTQSQDVKNVYIKYLQTLRFIIAYR